MSSINRDRWQHNKLASVWMILFSNVIVLLLALIFHWNVVVMVLIYWAETVLIGLLNLVKMIIHFSPDDPYKNDLTTKLFLVVFYIGIFGGYIFVILCYIVLLAGYITETRSLHELLLMYVTSSFALGLVLLLISHIINFGKYCTTNEYRKGTLDALFLLGFSRTLLMQVSILVGGILVVILGQQAILLVLFVGLKTVVDIRADMREKESRDPNAKWYKMIF
jgi:hypothetical protein